MIFINIKELIQNVSVFCVLFVFFSGVKEFRILNKKKSNIEKKNLKIKSKKKKKNGYANFTPINSTISNYLIGWRVFIYFLNLSYLLLGKDRNCFL